MAKRGTSDHQALIDFWCEQWAARHNGSKYPFNGGRDAKVMKTLRGMVWSDADLRRYMQVYLDLDDAWMTARGHSLAVLQVNFPEVVQAAAAARQPAPVAKRLRGLAEWLASEK